MTRLGGSKDDVKLAQALLDQSIGVAAETYGAASLLVGGTSDDGDCEDVAVVADKDQLADESWAQVIQLLGISDAKVCLGAANPSFHAQVSPRLSPLPSQLQSPRDETADVSKMLGSSGASAEVTGLDSSTKAKRYTVSSEAGDAILSVLVFKQSSTGNWIVLLGCGPIFE